MLAVQINKLLIICTISSLIAHMHCHCEAVNKYKRSLHLKFMHLMCAMAVNKNALKVKPLVPFNGDLVKPDVQSLVKKEKMCYLAKGRCN